MVSVREIRYWSSRSLVSTSYIGRLTRTASLLWNC
ncbi:Uncharacterised protein [Bordetella pertussis]|nr:Uncharacterised protein [Bordetella pertussis]